MPIVQAYKCPKTKKLFEEKEKYIAHLKVQACESFRNEENHVRASIIKNKFDDLRKNARSLNDVAEWLLAHQRYLVHLAVRYDKLSSKRTKMSNFMTDIKFTDIVYEFWGRNTHQRPLNGVTNFSSTPDQVTGYPCIRCDVSYVGNGGNALPDLGLDFTGIMFGSGGGDDLRHDYQAMLFAEDWPFIGAYFLFEARNRSLSDAMQRVLLYAFPGITIEQYRTYQDAGLLPESTDEFTNWMLGFVDVQRAAPPFAETLPDDLVSAV